MIVPVNVVLALSAVLFGIGVFGFLARRNIILMLVSVEVRLNAVILSLAGFSRHLVDSSGQVLLRVIRYRPSSMPRRLTAIQRSRGSNSRIRAP